MKRHLFKTTVCTLMAVLFFGCISSIDKRRYRKGYHFAHSSNVKTKAKDTDVQKTKESVETVVVLKEETNLTVVNETSDVRELKKPGEDYLRRDPVVMNESDTHTAIIKARTISDQETEVVAQPVSSLTTKKDKTSGAWYFLSLLLLPFTYFFSKRTSKATQWAANNKTRSRSLVALGNVVGLGSSFGLGYIFDLEIEKWMGAIALGLCMGSYGFQSFKVSNRKKMQQRSISIPLFGIAAAFGSFALGCNFADSSTATEMAEGLKALVTVLLIALYIFSILVLFVACCSIGCEGYIFLSVIAMFGGSYLVGFLIFLGIMNMYKNPEAKEERTGKASTIAFFLALAIAILFAILMFA